MALFSLSFVIGLGFGPYFYPHSELLLKQMPARKNRDFLALAGFLRFRYLGAILLTCRRRREADLHGTSFLGSPGV